MSVAGSAQILPTTTTPTNKQIGTALVKTGELSVSAARGLLEYDRKNKVSEKFAAWLRKELLKEK